jgi:hypothetical protein
MQSKISSHPQEFFGNRFLPAEAPENILLSFIGRHPAYALAKNEQVEKINKEP